MFSSLPNFALFVFICQFQGFPFGAILVHGKRPGLRVHREITGVLKGKPSVWIDWNWIVLGIWLLQGFWVKEPIFLFFVGNGAG